MHRNPWLAGSSLTGRLCRRPDAKNAIGTIACCTHMLPRVLNCQDNAEWAQHAGRRMLQELREAFTNLRREHTTRCLILKSTVPGAFCAGADLKASAPDGCAADRGMRSIWSCSSWLSCAAGAHPHDAAGRGCVRQRPPGSHGGAAGGAA